MGTKLLVIGIDALDLDQVSRFEHDLPNIRRLRELSPTIKLNSVCPPDSDTAWASIYTGTNPAKHGIVQYIDPLEKSTRYVSADIDNSAIKGKAFWDIAGTAGKRVCVLFPHLGFPIWPVNGAMVGRSAIKDEVLAHPESIVRQYDLRKTNVVKGMPGRRKRAYVEANERLLSAQTTFSLDMLEKEDWDLFFVYTSTLDMIQHYFWNYCDDSDPSYPGDNPHRDTIKMFYILHDHMIGRLLSKCTSDTTTLVLSDHGHGMRPVKAFNVNELLRRKGFLVLKDKAVEKGVSKFIDETKDHALRIVSRYGLGNVASKLLRLLPWARMLYSSPMAIDWEHTLAFATNLSGIKAYSYSGIVIQWEKMKRSHFEDLRDKIILDLLKVHDPETGDRLVKWVRKREDLYEGPHIEKYPHLVIELVDGYGVGLTTDGSLFGKTSSHHMVSGSHRSEGAMFLISNEESPKCRTEMNLIDVAPTILDCLDTDVPDWIEGSSIFKN